MDRHRTQLPERPGRKRDGRNRRRPGRWLAVLVLLFGVALFVREQWLPGLQRWWQDELGPRLRGEPPLREVEAPPGGLVRHEFPGSRPEIRPEDLQFQPQAAETLALRVRDFVPAGFQIPAVSHPVALSTDADGILRRVPDGLGREVRFGILRVGPGAGYGFVLERRADGYRLVLDADGDGEIAAVEFRDAANTGARFALSVDLPLVAVSGLGDPQAVYRLWLFAPGEADPFRGLRVYARTQLRGTVGLAGRTYTAWLADNEILDGDYSNDGIGIDLDGDGRIAAAQEWIRPGARLVMDRRSYRFAIAPQ